MPPWFIDIESATEIEAKSNGTPPALRMPAQASRANSPSSALHGVTRPVSIPLEGRWDGRDIQVVGSLDVRFADYQIGAPNIGGFVSVKDQGVMEFQIFFRKT